MVLLLAGCPSPSPVVCLPLARCAGVLEAHAAFVRALPTFDVRAPIEVVVWPPTHDLLPESPGFTQGLTHPDGLLEVTAPAVLCHELGHLHLQRVTGDPDAGHHAEWLFGPAGSASVEGRCRTLLDVRQ